MQTTGVGIIGYGLSGSTFHAPVIARTPGLRVAAIVSSQPQKVAAAWPEAKLYAEVPALLRDPAVGLVVVCSPNGLHGDHARQALEAGRPVVVEKP
jgi:scyllo-inositol 2-dehydrogenase (NADP+)